VTDFLSRLFAQSLKEWAYAGIFLELTGAAASHASHHDEAKDVGISLLPLDNQLIWTEHKLSRYTGQMKKLGVFEGKAHFSALIDAAEQGRVTVITKRGKPVAQVAPVPGRKPSDAFGLDEGLITIAPDFDKTPADFGDYA
jgi:prevent-host-death family protein